ncbi:SGNH/GDSL hydrolase family protein [Flagellimonas hymeniacidonis]|uniref:SGNH/GDSL hydrolase family protein n=1 Tax=Flagellimonas hymeniacidonis TaxID=2603628 RepID=A0A5C8UZU1_9FLAO|nr:GDSL-type esterase/lipase family protein [Flagellimonas hymeniacidonis]TXN34342.1 SGNH/GDSL hydrolase family protein [Flagellimonas hymeniacidonis]
MCKYTFILVLCFLLAIPAKLIGQHDAIPFLALGDSYTAATSEKKVNSWPVQLAQILKKKGIKINSPEILAKAGWTSTDLIENMEKQQLSNSFGLVGLLIGVNNQYKNKDIDIFKREFPRLLETSIALAKNDPKNVFVLSIPDWSVTPFARFKDKKKIVKELNNYNSIIEEEAKKRDVLFIEITQSSKNAAVNPSLIASDSLHPSKKMYKLWAKKISKKLFK